MPAPSSALTDHPPIRIAWTTTATATEARSLAAHLLGAGAACVHLDPPMRALYHWEGTLHEDTETRLWVKYHPSLESTLREVLSAHHPYRVPQWIALDATAALPAYAAWVSAAMEARHEPS